MRGNFLEHEHIISCRKQLICIQYVYLDIDLEHDYILLHTKDVQMTHPKYSSFAGIMTEVRKILFIMHDINAKPLLWDMNC